MKTIKMLFMKLMIKYREHCEDVAQLKIERAEAQLNVAIAKKEIACMKADPTFADTHMEEALPYLDKAIDKYEEALFCERSWSYLGAASITGKALSCIPILLLLTLAILFVGDKVAGLLGLPLFGTQYYITLAVTLLVMAIPAVIGIDKGFLHSIAMRIKIARLKSLRKNISDVLFLNEFA